MKHVATLVGLLLVGCAAPVAVTTPEALEGLAGTWQGWIVTASDFAPAVLNIQADGTFEMSGIRSPDVRTITGALVLGDGTLRLNGAGGWRGTVAISRMAGRRVLTIERDDRLSSARFTASPP